MKTGNELSIYNRFLACKTHFTSKSFDYFENHKKIKSAHFSWKRNEKNSKSLKNKLKSHLIYDDDIDLFFACNIIRMLINGEKILVFKFIDDECFDCYKAVKSFLDSLEYKMVEILKNETEGGFIPYMVKEYCKPKKDEQPPILITMYSGGPASIEIFTLFNLIFSLTKHYVLYYDMDLNHVEWVNKYKPFLRKHIKVMEKFK